MTAPDCCLETSIYINFFLFQNTRRMRVEPIKITRDESFLLFFSLLFPLFFTRFFFFLLHLHSHSNLFERIIHERVMLEMHSREEGSAAIRPSTTFALLYFFFLLSSILFSRHYSTHCGCAYFLSRGRPMQIAIVLSIFWR